MTWSETGDFQSRKERINLPEKLWGSCNIGDEIEIINVPGDSSAYHREGIFASDGNFALDRVLLISEYVVAAIAGIVALFFAVYSIKSRKHHDPNVNSLWR